MVLQSRMEWNRVTEIVLAGAVCVWPASLAGRIARLRGGKPVFWIMTGLASGPFAWLAALACYAFHRSEPSLRGTRVDERASY